MRKYKIGTHANGLSVHGTLLHEVTGYNAKTRHYSGATHERTSKGIRSKMWTIHEDKIEGTHLELRFEKEEKDEKI